RRLGRDLGPATHRVRHRGRISRGLSPTTPNRRFACPVIRMSQPRGYVRFRVVGRAYDKVSKSDSDLDGPGPFLECRGAGSWCSRRALGAAVWCRPLVAAELEVRYLQRVIY